MEFTKYKKYKFPESEYHKEDIIGNNQKGILVLSPENKLSNSNYILLQKILGAKNVDLDEDTLILRLPENPDINISRIIRDHNIKHLIIFGIQPKQVGINIQWKLYQKTKLGQLCILVSHNLEDLSNNQSLKRSLWQQLKNWDL